MQKAIVQRSDLPADWSQSPAPDPVGAAGDDSRYSECIGRPDPKTVRTASKASDEFRLGDGMQIISTAQTMPDVARAKADFAALRGDRGGPCLRQRLANAIDRRSAAGSAPESVSVERLPGVDLGDETVAFRATLAYPAGDGGPKSTYVDLVYVRKAKVEVAVTLSSAQEPFPADVEGAVLTRVVGRIQP